MSYPWKTFGIVLLVSLLWNVLYFAGWLPENEPIHRLLEWKQGGFEMSRKDAKPIPLAAPIIFSDEQASYDLLRPDDFPNGWQVQKSNLSLDAKHLDFMVAKRINISLEIHVNESSAIAAYNSMKYDAQMTTDSMGISGRKVEEIKKYSMFVWNKSEINFGGAERWEVIGQYANLTMTVIHDGSIGAPKKKFAEEIAKKQMDKIMGE